MKQTHNLPKHEHRPSYNERSAAAKITRSLQQEKGVKIEGRAFSSIDSAAEALGKTRSVIAGMLRNGEATFLEPAQIKLPTPPWSK